MINRLERRLDPFSLRLWTVVAGVLGAAALLGSHPSPKWLALILLGAGAVAVSRHPTLGLAALVAVALVLPTYVDTGTDVQLNLASLLVPAMLGLWLLIMVRHQDVQLPRSRTTTPLLLFLLSGLLALVAGTATWDVAVPRASNFILVQLAQWAIFAFSAGAFWLTGGLIRDETWLRRLTCFYLALAGILAILRIIPGVDALVARFATFAVDRAPFWLLLAALVGGQLLFNRGLSFRWRAFLLIVLGAVSFYAFILERKTLSNLAGVLPVFAILAWIRWPRWRWAYVVLVILALSLFFPSVYQFAGGEAEWDESGGSRLALAGRVIELTMRNPITGLGPAAYRPYGRLVPLVYQGAYYNNLGLSSHNNYVDLFSHVGLLGLGLFFWFAVEVIRLAVRLRARYKDGFAAGYVNGMLAAWIGALVVMVLADWMLPFVYNIGFVGFQASVLVWLFLGGLVALDNMPNHRVASLPRNDL